MASGWNLWVWLQYIGVASGWCCNFPYSTCIISFFWQQHAYFIVNLKKNF